MDDDHDPLGYGNLAAMDRYFTWAVKYTAFEGIYLSEGGDAQCFKAENMTVLYGGHAMSRVRRNWCDHEGFLCVPIFNVKVQVHQFGSGLERPE